MIESFGWCAGCGRGFHAVNGRRYCDGCEGAMATNRALLHSTPHPVFRSISEAYAELADAAGKVDEFHGRMRPDLTPYSTSPTSWH